MRFTQDGGVIITPEEIIAMSEPAPPVPSERNDFTFMEEVVARITAGERIVDMAESMDTPVSHIMAAYRVAMQAQLQVNEVRLRSPNAEVLHVITKNGGSILADERQTPQRADLPCMGYVRVSVPSDWRRSGKEPIPFEGAQPGDLLEMVIPDTAGPVAIVNRTAEELMGAQFTYALSRQTEPFETDARGEDALQAEVYCWAATVAADEIIQALRAEASAEA